MGVLEVYKDTLNPRYKFPLIMVVGREGNSEIDELVNETGYYDFDEAPKCNFWNSAYSIYGWANGLDAQKVKSICRQKNCAPIIFTDVSPLGIKNEVIDKNSIRRNKSEALLHQNVENVFSHQDVIQRLKLVILAGHDIDPKYRYPSELFMEKCKSNNIPFIETKFMYGGNRKFNIETIEKEKKTKVFRDVHSEFIKMAD